VKILYIGGTGIISSACSELALKKGYQLFHLNRGNTNSLRPVPGVSTLKGDIRDRHAVTALLQGHFFDAVVDWISFEPDHIKQNIEIFSGITDQFVFISSASAYQTPPQKWPVSEETPLYNPFWLYSRNKIACEEILKEANKTQGFPYTIVRPSHTYDKTLIPLEGGYTQLHRMKLGKTIVIHGDGSSLWTLTHHKDFAKGLVGILGKKEALAEVFHITSDMYYSWDRIAQILAEKSGFSPDIVHIPSEVIARYDQKIGASLMGDKTHSMIFDNSKIKKLVPDFNCTIPFEEGAEEIIQWYNSHPDYQQVNEELDKLFDRMVKDYQQGTFPTA